MRTSKTPIILYLCDGDDPNCKKTNCYKCGGDCKHTKDIAHAVNYSAETIRSVSAFGNEIIKVAYFENETPVIAGYDRALGADKTALAVAAANAYNERERARLADYNELHGTQYEMPAEFADIENDKKSN